VSGAGAGGREALQSGKMQVGTGIEQIILKLFSGDHFAAFFQNQQQVLSFL
jgi:hypothetical protein